MADSSATIWCAILWAISFGGTQIFAQDIFTNVWAVKVSGTSVQKAKQVALKHGFSYDKHVSLS